MGADHDDAVAGPVPQAEPAPASGLDLAPVSSFGAMPVFAGPSADIPIGTVGWLARTSDERRAEVIHSIQRTSGNRAACRMLARIPLDGAGPAVRAESGESQRELVAAALASRDAGDVKRIRDFSAATEPERFELIEILLGQGWVGPLDELALEQIWGSFGERLGEVAGSAARFAVWRRCVDRGAELDDLPALTRLKEDFGADVKAVAGRHLADNRAYVLEEIQRFGATAADAAQAEQQAGATADLQEAARQVARAEDAQRALRALQVGWDWQVHDRPGGGTSSERVPASFDPQAPPMLRPSGSEDPPLPRWEDVKTQYDRASDVIRGLLNRHPALYAAAHDGGAAEVATASPAQARRVVVGALQRVQGNIDATLPKLDSGDLDWRDLRPIHAQLFAGGQAGVSGTDWSQPFTRWVADDVLSDHESREFWIALGLGSLAAAAFVVASLATAGSATVFIAAAVGVGASGLQAGMSWEQYEDLARAEDATVSDERALLARGQASAALVQAALDTVFLFLDVYGVAARSVGAVSRAAGREALEAGERALGGRATREAGEAAAQRGGAEAAEQVAESALLAESQAIVRFGDATHTLKAVRRGGRLELWLCTNCAKLIDQIDEVLPTIPTSGEHRWAAERLGRIRARAAELQRRIDAGEIAFDRIPGEVNQLAEQLRNLGTRYPDARGLEFFKTFRARPDYDALASRLGFERIRATSHGQPVYRRGNRYITPDVDRHNGGIWKAAEGSEANLRNRAMRQGTYNEDLTARVGD